MPSCTIEDCSFCEITGEDTVVSFSIEDVWRECLCELEY